jgi:hypothetical protein
MPLPLHIFEPRYRDMVRDAARGPRLIGMALLRGDWERDYHGTPPIFATGTVGEMVRMEELPDGRFNIVLLGVREYTIVRELGRTSYREAEVVWREPVADPLPPDTRERVTAVVRRYLGWLGKDVGAGRVVPENVDDEVFVNFLAQHLDVAPVERQALLEAPTLVERARRLVEVVEFRLEELRTPRAPTPERAH